MRERYASGSVIGRGAPCSVAGDRQRGVCRRDAGARRRHDTPSTRILADTPAVEATSRFQAACSMVVSVTLKGAGDA